MFLLRSDDAARWWVRSRRRDLTAGPLDPASVHDYLFEFVPRGAGHVALRLVHRPAMFLRVGGQGEVRLADARSDLDAGWLVETTIRMRRGLSHPEAISLSPCAFPEGYLRCEGARLFADVLTSDRWWPSASFHPVAQAALSDGDVPEQWDLQGTRDVPRIPLGVGSGLT